MVNIFNSNNELQSYKSEFDKIKQQATSFIESTFKNSKELINNALPQVQNIQTSSVEKEYYAMLDFGQLANQDVFGFGIEQLNVSGDSRKTIQQTRGIYNEDKSTVENNFYVDTWWKGPESLTLAGVIELPYGYTIDKDPNKNPVNIYYEERGQQVVNNYLSFYDFIETMFKWDSDPVKVNKGYCLYLYDYYKNKKYLVTFKSRKWQTATNRQSLLQFVFDFVILNEETIQ